MSVSLISIYHSLPYPLRMVAASIRGYQLSWWRYDHNTDLLVDEALEREQWSETQWKMWREERLARVLHRAAKKVPYYKEYWSMRRQKGDYSSWEDLSNWPVLKKETLRTAPQAFVAEDCNTQLMFEEHTSGTSGKPLTLWWSHDTVLHWYALFEARIRAWNDVSRHDHWAILGGQLITPVRQERPPYWVWNQGLRQLYLSSYHIKPSTVHHYFDAIEKHKIVYIFGYSSSLESLAALALEQGLQLSAKLKVVISNAEPLYQYQRELISKVFQCDVHSTYGMSEIVATASECKRGKLHLWPEVGIVEVVSPECKVNTSTSGTGSLIATGLFNIDMPLIRYETGDMVALDNNEALCLCGKGLPRLKCVTGRTDDMILTPDGRRIGRLDPVFKTNFSIREAQIVQDTPSRILVRYVPAPGFTKNDENAIRESLRDHLGSNMQVLTEAVDQIPRGPGGKFRAVISHIPHNR